MNRIAALGAKRLRNYFADDEKILDKYKVVLAIPPDDEYIYEGDDLFDDESLTDLKCSRIMDLTEGNEIARTALELAVLRYIEPVTGELLELIAPGNKDGITLETAARVCGFGGVSTCIPLINDAYERLRILLSSRNDKSDIPRAVLKAEYPLICYMANTSVFEVDTLKFCREYIPGGEPPAVYSIEDDVVDLADRVYNLFTRSDPMTAFGPFHPVNGPGQPMTGSYQPVSGTEASKEAVLPRCFDPDPVTLVINGERDSGKGRAMERVAWELDTGVLIADAGFLIKVEKLSGMLRKLFLHCLLSNTLLCIENIPRGKDGERLIKEVRRGYDYFGPRPLILLCETGVNPVYFLEGRIISMDIRKSTRRQAFLLWKGFLEEYGLADRFNANSIAAKMNLKAGQIKRICDLLVTYEKSTGILADTRQIYKFCYEVLDDGRYENIKQVESAYKLEDLKVDPKVMTALRDICDQIEYSEKIYHDWGMAGKYEYGRCVSAILAGPPGTGKTMAVHALANELGLRLYKVDLSQIVDKYIGETEKRLEEVFLKAEKSHMILFFDEADALMGKRSETKDSKDKYANTEIAYILQRIEEFDGIVFLSTNYLQNIDAAFMRRIKYIIHFDLPDAETRREIWLSSFAEGVPLAQDIDWDMLADKYNISGGNIKNIVLNASFLAAAEDKPVNMKHIMKALIRENSKDNKVTFSADYGIYSHLARV